MLALQSSSGISIWAALVSVVVTQAQVANIWYLFRAADDTRYGVPVATPPSLRDWLNLTQLLVQWLCSLFLYDRNLLGSDLAHNLSIASSWSSYCLPAQRALSLIQQISTPELGRRRARSPYWLFMLFSFWPRYQLDNHLGTSSSSWAMASISRSYSPFCSSCS